MKKRRVSAGVPSRFNVIAASGKMRQMDPWLIAFVLAVVFVAATAQTVTGFGFALVAVPFLIIVLEPEEVESTLRRFREVKDHLRTLLKDPELMRLLNEQKAGEDKAGG